MTTLYEISNAISAEADTSKATQINICIASCLKFSTVATSQLKTHEFHEKWLGRHRDSFPKIKQREFNVYRKAVGVAATKGKKGRKARQSKLSAEQKADRIERLLNRRSQHSTEIKAKEKGQKTLAGHIASAKKTSKKMEIDDSDSDSDSDSEL